MGGLVQGAIGALHIIDVIMRKKDYVDILKPHFKTSARKITL